MSTPRRALSIKNAGIKARGYDADTPVTLSGLRPAMVRGSCPANMAGGIRDSSVFPWGTGEIYGCLLRVSD